MRSNPKSTDIVTGIRSKSCFCSTTFWAVFFLAIEGIASHLEDALSDGHLVSADIFAILRIIAATVAGFLGRYNASEILYTPKGFPGRDKEAAETPTNIPGD
jgi:hypothetical protein